jgi:signal transduction histidine kinase
MTEKMFVNNASHEINNPLTAIQGECEVALLMEHKPAEYRDIIERILNETKRIITIMHELLLFSHARNGKIAEENTNNILLSTVVKPLCNGNVKLQIYNDITVKADFELLNIAIHNLIGNAVKYSNGNNVEVIINKPQLIIKDQGIGIPAADLENIFQPFFRASNTGSTSGKGIGLALAKSILERLGAKITVTSKVEEGTAFKVGFK